jgi:hypothetical protein
MRGWIYNTDLESYKGLMLQEHANPVIIETTDEKSLVQMTASAMQTWMTVGKHFEFG